MKTSHLYSKLLLLLLSHFSCVQLCVIPQTAAHQAPPSLGFSRQEHWSGLPFPPPMHESEKWKWSRSVVSDPQRSHGLQPSRLLRPWDFPGKSTGVGCHCLLPDLKALLLTCGCRCPKEEHWDSHGIWWYAFMEHWFYSVSEEVLNLFQIKGWFCMWVFFFYPQSFLLGILFCLISWT